ncbi:MAG: CARDB domain-containing protein [Candidatus Promineifilaceae bacterium]|nr:CARDB domain-containing protein [Candidatus Promineifilaceae bacterium]
MNMPQPNKIKREAGQALVEFSLTLLVLASLLLMIVEAGRLFMGWATVQNAARAGGRYAITGQFETDCLAGSPPCSNPRVESIKTVARQASAGLAIDPDAGYGQAGYHDVEVASINADNVWESGYAGRAGAPVLVRVIYRMSVITPLFRPIAESVQLTGQVTLNNENYEQFYNSVVDNTPPDLPPPPTPGPKMADLAIEARSTPAVVVIDQLLNYELRVTNNGPNEARGITVRNHLPAGTTFVSATPASACAHLDGVVTCKPPPLPPEGFYDLVIQVRAPATPPAPDGRMLNEVEVSSAARDEVPDNNRDTASTLVVESAVVADLAITGHGDFPDPVIIGQPLQYTIFVKNNGPGDATGVVVTDPLPRGVSLQSVEASPGLCELSAGTVNCFLGDLRAEDRATIRIVVDAPQAPGTIANPASISGQEGDPDPDNNSWTQTTTVLPEWVDLYVQPTDAPDPVHVDENLLYAVRVGNRGPAEATNVSLLSELPEGVEFVSAVGTQGSCSGGAIVQCALGSLLPGAEANVNIVVRPTVDGTAVNRVTLSSDQEETDVGDNQAVVVTTVTRSSDLAVTKAAIPGADPIAGEILAYRIVVTNEGRSPATGVAIEDRLPAELSFVRAQTTQGSCSQSGSRVICLLGNMAWDDAAEVIIEVIPEQEGVYTNEVRVSADQFDPDPADNLARVTDTVGPALEPFIVVNPVCGRIDSTFRVRGFNWPSTGRQDISVYWDNVADENLLGVVEENGTLWTLETRVPATASDDLHTIIAVRRRVTVQTAFTVPCPAPNLIATGLELVSPTPLLVDEPVTFRVNIRNTGNVDAVSQFFVGLYSDPLPAPDATSTHISPTYRLELVALNGLPIGASRTLTLTARSGFGESGPHDIYVVADSDPGPEGIITEGREGDNISDPLTVEVAVPAGVTPTPTSTPGATPTPDPAPAPTGALVGQAFLFSPGGRILPQAGVQVRAFDGGGAMAVETFTDADGSYMMELAPDSYTVTACIIIEGVSHNYSVTGVEVTADQVTVEDLFLEEGPCG